MDRILEFMNNIQLNIYHDNFTIDLMDLFPQAKQGNISFFTLNNIISLYITFNRLLAHGDRVMLDTKLKKLLNSQQHNILKRLHFNILLCQEIKYCYSNDTNTEDNISNSLILCSYYLGKYNFDIYLTMEELSLSVSTSKNIITFGCHPKIGELYIGVLFGDIPHTLPNPMNNRCIAYLAAIKKGNKDIIKLIYDNILLRMFLHKEVLIYATGSYDIGTCLCAVITNMF